MAPFTLTVERPQTPAGQEALKRQVALIHAQAASRRIQALRCPAGQQRELLEAVIAAAKSTP